MSVIKLNVFDIKMLIMLFYFRVADEQSLSRNSLYDPSDTNGIKINVFHTV